MFRLQICAHTERGVFFGTYAKHEKREELEHMLDLIEDNLNKITRISFVNHDTSRTTLVENIIKNSVITFQIESI